VKIEKIEIAEFLPCTLHGIEVFSGTIEPKLAVGDASNVSCTLHHCAEPNKPPIGDAATRYPASLWPSS